MLLGGGVFDVAEEPAIVVKGMDKPLRSYIVQRAKPRAFRLERRGMEGIECRMVGRDAELKRLSDAFEDVIADETLSRITIVGDPKQIRDRAFHSAAQYFKAIAAIDPVMVQLEDLHRADEGSLDFINPVAQSCRDCSILIVCAARPALLERRPLWGSGQGNHERIELAPLARRSSRELADALLQTLQQPYLALRELITGGAEGNPFYMEELTKMLIDDGVIIVGDDVWQVVPERLARVHVPPTLVGVLQARVDALPPLEKLALQVASVGGHVFWADALASIDPTLVEALSALMARELIYGRETSAFEGVGEYVFKHNVLHQVTYESVLKRDRRERHGRCAGWLVAQSGKRVSEHQALIAHHYEKAGDLVNAARYFSVAAEDAIKSYANAAALDHLGRALALTLTLTPDDDLRGRFGSLRSRIGVLSATSRRDEQRQDAEQLAQLADRIGDDALRADAAGRLARHAFYTGDYQRASSEAERGVLRAAAAGIPLAGRDAHACWVDALRLMGRHDEALVQVEKLAATARAQGDNDAYLRVRASLWGMAVDRGQYGVALEHFTRGLAFSRGQGDRVKEATVLGSMGDVQRCLGNFREAIELGNAATLICRETGIVVQEALALYRRIGREMMAIECLVGLALASLAGDRSDEALAFIGEVTAYLDGGGTVDGTENPIGIYLACHDVLRGVGHGGAKAYLASGHALLMQRAEPLGPADREGFLRRVPSHRALLDAVEDADHLATTTAICNGLSAPRRAACRATSRRPPSSLPA